MSHFLIENRIRFGSKIGSDRSNFWPPIFRGGRVRTRMRFLYFFKKLIFSSQIPANYLANTRFTSRDPPFAIKMGRFPGSQKHPFFQEFAGIWLETQKKEAQKKSKNGHFWPFFLKFRLFLSPSCAFLWRGVRDPQKFRSGDKNRTPSDRPSRFSIGWGFLPPQKQEFAGIWLEIQKICAKITVFGGFLPFQNKNGLFLKRHKKKKVKKWSFLSLFWSYKKRYLNFKGLFLTLFPAFKCDLFWSLEPFNKAHKKKFFKSTVKKRSLPPVLWGYSRNRTA